MDWTVEFSARLAAARKVGVVRTVSFSVTELQAHDDSRGAREIADALAHQIGLRPLGHGWWPLSRTEARAAVSAALERDLAYSAECMPATDALAFADEFLTRFGPDANFLTNATLPTAEQAKTTGWRASWNPLTNATFDVGVFGVGRGEAALLWVEDED
jgi:hypothetical protein